MFLEEGPNEPEYVLWLNKEVFMHLVPDMLSHGKRKNKKFVEHLHEILLKVKHPSFEDIFKNTDYASSTVTFLKSYLRKTGYFDDDKLNGTFFFEYYGTAKKYYDLKQELSVSKVDSAVLDDIELNNIYSHKDIMEILKNNVDIKFEFPADVEGGSLDYSNHDVQYVKLNHIGINSDIPYPLEFAFRCNRCGALIRFDEFPKGRKCPLSACSGVLKRDKINDTQADIHASQVMYNQKSIPVLSLVDLPNGEFTAALLVLTDDKSTAYYLFVLAIEEKKYESADLEIKSGGHAVWQLCDIIDDIHRIRADYHIQGMDYYKASLLMQAVANASGYKSYNILIAGKSGGAKTATARWYYNTFSLACKVQDVVSVSLAGLVGSTSTITMNDRNIQIREPGLLTKHEFVVLDEIYNEIDDSLMGKLKGALSSPTISKEVHNNRTEADKNASVVATANIKPAVYNKFRAEFNEYAQDYLLDPDGYSSKDMYAKQAYDLLRFNNDALAIAAKTVELKCAANGSNWIDGQALSDLERFGLIFYVGDPSNDDDGSVPDHIFDDTDAKITTPALQKMIFSQEIRDYIQYCSNIKVVIDDEMMDRVREFVSKLWLNDHIHSKSRGMMNINKTLQFSAMLCGRDYLNDLDFEFVESLFGLTCRWIEIDDMARHVDERSTDEKQYDRRAPDPSEIEKFIDARFKRYELRSDGGAPFDRGLINISCDIMTEFGIDDQSISMHHIEKYVEKNSTNEFDKHLIPSDGPEVISFFDKVGESLTQGEFKDRLIDEFGRKKEIPLKDLDEFREKCNMSVGVLNGHLAKFREKGMIINAGESIRWI